MFARGRVPRGSVSGRTHRSAPTRWGRRSGTNGNWRETTPCTRGGTEPAPYRGGRAGKRRGCLGGGEVWSPRPTEAPQVVCSEGPMWASAPTKGEQAASTTRASGAQRSGRERWVEIAAEITPKGASNAGQSLSQPAADSSLYTREPCPAGDGGSGRRGRRPLRNETEARCDCPGQRSERGKSRWSNSGFAR